MGWQSEEDCMAVTIESFEGLTVTPNSPFSSLGAAKGYLQVGFIELFDVLLRSPSP